MRGVVCAALALALLRPQAVTAGPASFAIELSTPPVIRDSTPVVTCTVMFLIQDITSGDFYAQRIRIPPGETDRAVGHRLPCPVDLLPRLPNAAREVCNIRANDKRTCVFADMSREFATRPEISNTAAGASRCQSDAATHIAAACWMNGAAGICNVGCGNSSAEAISRARSRCEEKQQRSCPVNVVAPVSDEFPSSQDAPAPAAAPKPPARK